MMDIIPALEVCPFCNGEVGLNIDEPEDGGGVSLEHKDDRSCIMGDLLGLDFPAGTTLQDIVNEWNSRPQTNEWIVEADLLRHTLDRALVLLETSFNKENAGPFIEETRKMLKGEE